MPVARLKPHALGAWNQAKLGARRRPNFDIARAQQADQNPKRAGVCSAIPLERGGGPRHIRPSLFAGGISSNVAKRGADLA